jgi:hypothetical protein
MRNIKHRHLEEKSFAAGGAAKQWSAKETEQGVLRAEENDLSRRVCGRPAHGGVADRTSAHLLPHQIELGFLRRAIDEERDPH